jgi:hypothetical protein
MVIPKFDANSDVGQAVPDAMCPGRKQRTPSPCDRRPSVVVWFENGSFASRTYWPDPGRADESGLRQAQRDLRN